MMKKEDLVTVAKTQDTYYGKYAYRFLIDLTGVVIMRTEAEPVLWGHAVRTQKYSITEGQFLSLNVCGLTEKFKTIDDAIDTVNKLVQYD